MHWYWSSVFGLYRTYFIVFGLDSLDLSYICGLSFTIPFFISNRNCTTIPSNSKLHNDISSFNFIRFKYDRDLVDNFIGEYSNIDIIPKGYIEQMCDHIELFPVRNCNFLYIFTHSPTSPSINRRIALNNIFFNKTDLVGSNHVQYISCYRFELNNHIIDNFLIERSKYITNKIKHFDITHMSNTIEEYEADFFSIMLRNGRSSDHIRIYFKDDFNNFMI